MIVNKKKIHEKFARINESFFGEILLTRDAPINKLFDLNILTKSKNSFAFSKVNWTWAVSGGK